MTDLKSPRWIYFKGVLFLAGGVLASSLLIAEAPTLKVAFLLGVAIWCFARFYYFAFYVIEHYVEANFRFAGLTSFVQYVWKTKVPPDQGEATPVINSDERRGA